MIRFVPASAAKSLSSSLWQLSDPHSEGHTHDLFNWIDDPKGQRWLVVDTEFSITVHNDAKLGSIAEILQPWIDQKVLSLNTNSDLAALIESSRNGTLNVYNAFPQPFKEMSKTQDDMIELNLLQAYATNN